MGKCKALNTKRSVTQYDICKTKTTEKSKSEADAFFMKNVQKEKGERVVEGNMLWP